MELNEKHAAAVAIAGLTHMFANSVARWLLDLGEALERKDLKMSFEYFNEAAEKYEALGQALEGLKISLDELNKEISRPPPTTPLD